MRDQISASEAIRRARSLRPEEREWLKRLTDDETRQTVAGNMTLTKREEEKFRAIVTSKLGRFSLTGCAYVLGLADGAE